MEIKQTSDRPNVAAVCLALGALVFTLACPGPGGRTRQFTASGALVVDSSLTEDSGPPFVSIQSASDDDVRDYCSQLTFQPVGAGGDTAKIGTTFFTVRPQLKSGTYPIANLQKGRCIGIAERDVFSVSEYPEIALGQSYIWVEKINNVWTAVFVPVTSGNRSSMTVVLSTNSAAGPLQAKGFFVRPYACYTCDSKICCPRSTALDLSQETVDDIFEIVH